MRIYSWFSKHKNLKQDSSIVQIPIQIRQSPGTQIPVRQIKKSRLPEPVIAALGGVGNIETYRTVPNSKRIRLTLANPALVNNQQLQQIDLHMFIRIGKRIIHIIP